MPVFAGIFCFAEKIFSLWKPLAFIKKRSIMSYDFINKL